MTGLQQLSGPWWTGGRLPGRDRRGKISIVYEGKHFVNCNMQHPVVSLFLLHIREASRGLSGRKHRVFARGH